MADWGLAEAKGQETEAQEEQGWARGEAMEGTGMRLLEHSQVASRDEAFHQKQPRKSFGTALAGQSKQLQTLSRQAPEHQRSRLDC